MVLNAFEECISHSLTENANPIDVATMLNELARKLRDVSYNEKGGSPTTASSNAHPTAELVSLAEEELRRRRIRYRHLPQHLFGEAGWTMLLDLFVSQYRGRNIATTSACFASDVPSTTALRWLDVLERFELVERWAAENDKRVKYVSLTNDGDAAIRAILSDYLR